MAGVNLVFASTFEHIISATESQAILEEASVAPTRDEIDTVPDVVVVVVAQNKDDNSIDFGVFMAVYNAEDDAEHEQEDAISCGY